MRLATYRFVIFWSILIVQAGYGQSNKVEWPMHHIYLADKLCNGLDPANLNKDGLLDYVTNFKDNGNIGVMFHPGLEKVSREWPFTKIGNFPTAESACFGDMDGDGNVDAICTHGHQRETDSSGVAIIWNPGVNNVTDSSAGVAGDDIPGTVEIGNFLYVRVVDVNGDGAMDIIAGGRAEGKVKDPITGETPIVGLIWCEAPEDLGKRRDMTKWKTHNIDGDIISGHGFDFGDLDNDGDVDVALANADWGLEKLEDSRKYLQWYENPGNDTAKIVEEWQRHVLHVDTAFYTQPFVAIGDLNGDGLSDMITQTSKHILYFENNLNTPGIFKQLNILKTPFAQWRAQPLKMADINGDDRMDIMIGLIHHDGDLPKDIGALIWMEYEDSEPKETNWITHVIKLGDGFDGKHIFTGEKWDILTFTDVDRDGDLDIVANCEEYTKINVVWFENQL